MMGDRLTPVPDADLVAAVRRGELRAFDCLFDAYYIKLCEFAGQYVKSADVAEEIAADVLAGIWAIRATWEPSTSVAAYLYGAVRNRARNAVRGERRAHRWREWFGARGESPASGAMPPAPDTTLDAHDRARFLQQALQALPERARLIITLRWYHQLRYDEIAEVVESTSAAVQMQMSRALKVLREHLPEDLV